MSKYHSDAAVKIGKRIRAVRHHLGISLEDLGELSEISWTSIGKIERGASSPTAETLVRLATAMEVDPGSFLAGVTSDDYGRRVHQLTARDLIRARTAGTDAAGSEDLPDPSVAGDANDDPSMDGPGGSGGAGRSPGTPQSPFGPRR